MSAVTYYSDIDLLNVGQLIGTRLQNVTDVEQTALAALLGADNKGLSVYNSDQKQIFVWDGAEFDPIKIDVAGGLAFRGVVDASAALEGQTDNVSGYEYIVTTAGTIPASLDFGAAGIVTAYGDTNQSGVIEVEVGDRLLFVDSTGTGADVDGTQSNRADSLYVIERNAEQASELGLGLVRLATQQEVIDGIVDDEAVTPATLAGKLAADAYVRQFFGSFDLTIGVNTITHGLNLADRDAFTVNIMAGNSRIVMDVDSVDADTITLTTLLPITGAKVTVQGAL